MGKGKSTIRRPVSARVLLGLGGEGAPAVANPVFLKEVRSEFFARPWFRRSMFWGSGLILAGLAFATQEVEGALLANFLASFGLLVLLIPGVVATGFTRETEQGNLDFIRSSLLSLPQVMAGKFLGGLYSCAGIPLAAVLVTGAAMGCYRQRSYAHWPASTLWLAGFGVIITTVLFTSALATFASVLARRSLGALLLAYLMSGMIYLVYPLIALWMLFLFKVNPESPEGLLVGAFHPVWALASIEFQRGKLGALPAFFCIYLVGTLVLWFLSARRLERRWSVDD